MSFQPKMGKDRMTKDLLLKLMDEVSFQEELAAAWSSAAGFSKKQAARRELILKYLCPLVSRYGFAETWEGVTESHQSGSPWSSDPEVIAKFMIQKWLLDPDQQADGLAKKEMPGTELGVSTDAVRKLCEEIERPLQRFSLCAPLCSATCAPKAVTVETLPLHWARPEQQVLVLKEVLQPSEVQQIREWGLSRTGWVHANGHLINQFFDPVLSFKLWSRVEHVMPWSQSSMPVGLNEHLHGENRNGSGRSVFSALLYLSDSTGSDSGTTRFVSPQCPEVARCGRCDYTCGYCVDAPVATGDMVIFTQTLVHAGTEPKTAEKYVIRTDVMYPVVG
eukprot:symbB.v1.2.021294.t2/scaffold1830.1/size100772/3